MTSRVDASVEDLSEESSTPQGRSLKVFSSQRELLAHCLDALEAAGAKPVVLHARAGLPEYVSGDVDVVCESPSSECVRTVALSLSAANARVVQVIQHESTWHYVVIVLDASPTTFLALDIGRDFRRGGVRLFDGCIFVSERQSVDGMPVPRWPVDAAAYLVKRIDKMNVRQEDWRYVVDGFRQDPVAFRALLERTMGRRLALSLEDLLQSRSQMSDLSWRAIRRRVKLRAVTQRPWEAARGCVSEAVRAIRRSSQPTGLWVVLQGLDGAGKTTVADCLIEKVGPAFRRTKHAHMFGDERMAGAAAAPHILRPYSGVMSFVKAMYLVIRWWFGWIRGVYPEMVRSGLVVTERSPVDFAVDPVRFRCRLPRWVTQWVARRCPKADLYVLLRTSPACAVARKKELSLALATDLSKGYDEAAARWGMVVIDADRPLDEVVDDVSAAVLKVMEARTRDRLGL